MLTVFMVFQCEVPQPEVDQAYEERETARDARGSLFLLRGGAEEKISGAGQGGAGRKRSGRGGVTVKPRDIFGVGAGRGVHPCFAY